MEWFFDTPCKPVSVRKPVRAWDLANSGDVRELYEIEHVVEECHRRSSDRHWGGERHGSGNSAPFRRRRCPGTRC